MTSWNSRTTVQPFPRPVVFFANGLGDTLLALPALRALATLLPGEVTMICDVGVSARLLHDLRGWRFVETAMRRNVPDWTREFLVDEVLDRTHRCDLFVSLAPWMSGSLRRLLAGLAPVHSVGFFDGFDRQVPLRFDQHAADLLFGIPQALDPRLRLERFDGAPGFSPDAERLAASLRGEVPSSTRVLLIHADTGHNKMWPAERWIAVLDEFLDKRPDDIAWLIGTTPQPLDTGRHGDRVIPFYGLPLPVSLCLAGLADTFVGVDSCVLHAADLFRTPGVGLFGASSAEEYGFRFSPRSIALQAPAMTGIGVSDVLDALEHVDPIVDREPHGEAASQLLS